MRYSTGSGLGFRLVFMILAWLAVAPAAAQTQEVAGLASGPQMLPAFRGEVETPPAEIRQAEARPQAMPGDRGLLTEDPQMAARLPESQILTQAATQATAGATVKPRYFIKEPPLVTLPEYLRGGYITPDQKPYGTIIRNQKFWVNIIQEETVYVDFGSNKGAQPGDRFLIYVVNENFKGSYDYHNPVRHPVIDEKDRTRSENVANKIWQLWPGEEPGVWRNEMGDYFDKMLKQRGKLAGDSIRVVGVLEIIEPGADLSSARVTEMYGLIPRGALLTPYPKNLPAMVEQNFKAPAKNLTGYVLDHSEGYLMAGEKDLVYIDKGRADNVQLGDRFVVLAANKEEKIIYRSLIPYAEKLWKPEPRQMLDRKIGELVVVDTQENTATAVVVDSQEPILAGHRIRSKR